MKEKVERMKRGGVEEVKRTGENRQVSGLDGGVVVVVVVVWYSVYSRGVVVEGSWRVPGV